MAKKTLIDLIKQNKQTLITTIIVLIVFGSIKLLRHNELVNDSVTVDGKIIECDLVKISGACVVKIEFKTIDGIVRTSTNTLYKAKNCSVGKIVKIQYSLKSDLTNIVE